MADRPTRRRALTILAASGAALVSGGAMPRPDEEWRGSAMGADVRLLFAGGGDRSVARAVVEILDEVDRLEAVFSLQRGDSELSRLNAAGRLAAPGADLVAMIGLSRDIGRRTGGKFDPTVQPLWRLLADWYGDDVGRDDPPAERLAATRDLIGMSRVCLDADGLRLAPGMALTFNGIAQGTVTDRVVSLLRARGFRHVLVEMGETAALDGRAPRLDWRIDVPAAGRVVPLRDGAIATSAARAGGFGGGWHHLFDPASGRSAAHWAEVSVAHPSAAVADALSTALFATEAKRWAEVVARFPGALVWGLTADGERRVAGG